LPTTVEDRVHNATVLFGELIQEYGVHPNKPVEPLQGSLSPRGR
jgi:hypothetical protein